MSSPITGIDHAIIGVHDLEKAKDAYRRLGFTVTPRGRHVGWGTANYCMMFGSDYLELLGLVDPSAFTNGLDEFLKGGEGGLGIAFKTEDAAQAQVMLQEAGLTKESVRRLGRVLETEDGEVELSFDNLHLNPDATPGLRSFLCQHLQPEVMRRPEWLSHPNGAVGMASITVVVPNVALVIDAYTRLFGESAVIPTDQVIAVHTGSGVMMFSSPGDVYALHPELEEDKIREEPSLVAVQISVDDIDKTARVLEAGGVPFESEANGDIVVEPDQACGVLLEFSRSPRLAL